VPHLSQRGPHLVEFPSHNVKGLGDSDLESSQLGFKGLHMPIQRGKPAIREVALLALVITVTRAIGLN
jgi:hypothetical protein